MKLHPRTMTVQSADSELSMALLNIIGKYELTNGEIINILAGQLHHYSKYVVRNERHPEDDSKGANQA